MGNLKPELQSKLAAAFARFRTDPLEDLRIRVRRNRAAQLRALLARPSDLSLEAFNEEVWRFESQTLLDGDDVTGRLFNATSPPDDELQERFNTALSDGGLELHGNYHWGSGSYVFGSALRVHDDDRHGYVTQALRLLNQPLPPVDKAESIDAVPGFGQNTATGLVMVFHPKEFAICNGRSRAALASLGYEVAALADFEAAAADLRQRLGAEDFIQLDWFLYKFDPADVAERIVKISPGEQGRLWAECRDGGYICVGWDKVGDLRQYTSQEAFKEAYRAHYGADYNDQPHVISRLANQLWTLRELRPGDRVVANRGTSHVLAVGEVLAPGYVWREDRAEYRHTVLVRWDTSVEQDISPQGWWAVTTIAEVDPELYLAILSKRRTRSSRDRPVEPVRPTGYVEPPFERIRDEVRQAGLIMSPDLLRRFHLAVKTRGFVILAGISGTGKTWLTELYAGAVGARHEVVPVAPNWTANEDLLGYLSPIDGRYRDTAFSRFLRQAGHEYEQAQAEQRTPRPYLVTLDEMNLARVEHYFAKFLSAMEQRARKGAAEIELSAEERILLPPNLLFVGTVNIDETTQSFSDKVYDRAQLIELDAPRAALADHLGDADYGEMLLRIWDAVHAVAPFAFRVLSDIRSYVSEAGKMEISWQAALDEQIVQKILPKINGASPQVGAVLERLNELLVPHYPLTRGKIQHMLSGLQQYGVASFF